MKPDLDIEELISRAADGEALGPEEVRRLREALESSDGLQRARRWLLFERLLQGVIHRPDPAQLAAGKRRLLAQAAARAGVPLPGGDEGRWHPGRLVVVGFLTFAGILTLWLIAGSGYPPPRLEGKAEVLGGGRFVKGARVHGDPTGQVTIGGYARIELFGGALLQRMGIPYREVLSLEQGGVQVTHSGVGRITIRVADGRYRFTAGHRGPARYVVIWREQDREIQISVEQGRVELQSLAGVMTLEEGQSRRIRLGAAPPGGAAATGRR